ncbi:MAG: hypothetical protein RBU25_11265 [Lentisphaeria bacterium]|jgi:hypothetical protein|nr:hypothetical protein [Lentisphaeria bacterium]
MTKLSRISCIALTWNTAGECRGVLVRGRGERLAVQAHWQARADASASLAECLAEGLARLGTGESALVVAGAADAACGIAETTVPPLKTTELRGALGFELARACPLPPDRIVWGYRLLPAEKGKRVPARLFFLRQTAWEHWLESVGDLKIDALVPPQAALDPVLAELDLVLAAANGERFLFTRTGKGGRAVRPADATTPAFGNGPQPLAWDRLVPGPLANLPADQQATYAPALVLAAYGTTRGLVDDRATGFPVPYNLQPRRNQLNRFLATALVVLLVSLAATAIWREIAARSTLLAELRAEQARLQQGIDQRTASAGSVTEEATVALAKELEEARTDLDRPSLAAVLVELTETLGPNSWSHKFDWVDGAVTIDIEETDEDVDLVRNLEFSPVIGDVLEENKSRIVGKVNRQLKMNARWDMESERPGKPEDKGSPAPVPEPTVEPGTVPAGIPPQLLNRETP